MPDDEFDRHLAGRLRAYETRIPDEAAPEPGAPRLRRAPWAALIGVGGLTVVAGGLLALVLINAPLDNVGDPRSSPDASNGVPGPSVSESAAPSSSGSVGPSESPVGTATAAPTQTAASLTELFRVGDDASISFVDAIQPLPDGRFIAAVNTINAEHVPPIGPTEVHGSIYIGTADGAWELIDTGGVFDQVDITHLFAPPDDQLVAYGYRLSAPAPVQPATDGPVAFTSTDGVSWTEADVSPADGDIAHGRLGFVMARTISDETGTSMEIYRSDNARDWERVYRSPEGGSYSHHDAGAGDEGFVVTARRETGESSRPTTIASGDGVTWLESADQPAFAVSAGLYRLTPYGGDWIAAGFAGAEPGVPVFFSANGLDWEEVARVVDPAGRELFGSPSQLGAIDGRLFLSIALQAEGVESRPVGAWTSEDGRTWQMLELGDESEVRAAIATDETILMAGRAGNDRGDAVIWSANEAWFNR